MYCKDCRYWKEGNWGRRDGMSCDHPAHLIGYQYGPEDMSENGVLIENDEGWGWLTSPMFGCVNFEQKE